MRWLLIGLLLYGCGGKDVMSGSTGAGGRPDSGNSHAGMSAGGTAGSGQAGFGGGGGPGGFTDSNSHFFGWLPPPQAGTPCDAAGALQIFSGQGVVSGGTQCRNWVCDCLDGTWACDERACLTLSDHVCTPAAETAYGCSCGSDGMTCNSEQAEGGAGGKGNAAGESAGGNADAGGAGGQP